MSAAGLLAIVGVYCLLLLGVAWWTSRHADNDAFFVGNRRSNWMLVAFGMVGIFIGPVVLAVAFNLVEAWIEQGPRAVDDPVKE